MNLQTICRALAWASILAIVVITDGPIGLRPTTALPPNVERFAALAVVGLLFALAYPARRLIVLGALVVAVGALELGQFLAMGRHAGLRDAGAKVLGAMVGLGAGHLIDMVMQNRERMPAAPDPQQ
jgi:hypothetical protein